MPNTPYRTRTIHVAAGRAHTRNMPTAIDPMRQPIVERMTRLKFNGLSPVQQKRWIQDAITTLFEVYDERENGSDIRLWFRMQPRTAGNSSSEPGSSADHASQAEPVPPYSTPGKWFGKAKTASARKRGQAHHKYEEKRATPSRKIKLFE